MIKASAREKGGGGGLSMQLCCCARAYGSLLLCGLEIALGCHSTLYGLQTLLEDGDSFVPAPGLACIGEHVIRQPAELPCRHAGGGGGGGGTSI